MDDGVLGGARISQLEAVVEAFESEELPEGAKYYDCEIFATQGVWVKAPEENHHSRRDRKP